MTPEIDLLMQAMAALGIGLLIGLEREYGQRPVEGRARHREAAGIRTFAFVSLSGNLLTWLPEPHRLAAIALGLAFTAILALVAYRRTSGGRSGDVGITTEVVLVATFVLGALTGFGHVLPATIIAVVIFSLLHYKKMLHRFSHSLSRNDLRQALHFLIATVVVLPVLPDEVYGPFDAFNPQHIWLMVVLVSGIGFAAYAAIKAVGERGGLGLTGALGGMISSTAVTLAMARMSRRNARLRNACALSILLACGTMFPRTLALALILDPRLIGPLGIPMAAITAYAILITLLLWRVTALPSKGHEGESLYRPEINPLSFRTALAFGAFYAAVVFLVHMAQALYGSGGILAVAAFSGLSDVDPVTLSMADMSDSGELAVPLAAQAILIGAAANSLIKLGMGMAFAATPVRRWLIAGLLPMAGMALAGAWMLR